MTDPHVRVDLPSLDGNAHILVELAGLLVAGRPDADLYRRGAAPASHGEVGAALMRFADFAADQYQDAAALLAALSTKVRGAMTGYAGTDEDNARLVGEFLGPGTTLVVPADR